jgi:flavin-dependent dehydrogenase
MTKIAVIGGGPAGSTLGTLIKRYRPDIEIVILEREKFPREHVGESQLPMINAVMQEMGVWEKVEAAGFPIKTGVTYRWGQTDDLWDFELVPAHIFKEEPRPAKYEGHRILTTFNVERAIYDKILLDHAAELGCDVREETKVTKILRDGDTVKGLELESGEVIEADYYVDASGHIGVLRRGMDIQVDVPTNLQNVAFWDYWTDAEWPVSIGVGATRVQILSIDYGWLWFIPIGENKTSIGLVMPAVHYKKTGKKPAELYEEAIHADKRVGPLIKNAKSLNEFKTTKDWSFKAQRMYGENWFLVGEAAGFADPLLAAGLTLTHHAARHLAYTILALERGKLDKQWLLDHFQDTQEKRMMQHIRFADFWYKGNGLFTDLKEFTAELAKDEGLEMSADEAFRWLGTGGFLNDTQVVAGVAEFNIGAIKLMSQMFCGNASTWAVGTNNYFKMSLEGAKKEMIPLMNEGRITQEPCYVRDGKILPRTGIFERLITLISTEHRIPQIRIAFGELAKEMEHADLDATMDYLLELLEFMVQEGWVEAKVKKGIQMVPYRTPDESPNVHPNRDEHLDEMRAAAEGHTEEIEAKLQNPSAHHE